PAPAPVAAAAKLHRWQTVLRRGPLRPPSRFCAVNHDGRDCHWLQATWRLTLDNPMPPAPLLIFPLLMAFAAASDLLTMRISNRLVLLVVAAFLVTALVVGLPPQLLAMHAAFALLILVIAFAFFAFGWIGGGDAKFAAATALWLGGELLLPFIVYAGLF